VKQFPSFFFLRFSRCHLDLPVGLSCTGSTCNTTIALFARTWICLAGLQCLLFWLNDLLIGDTTIEALGNKMNPPPRPEDHMAGSTVPDQHSDLPVAQGLSTGSRHDTTPCPTPRRDGTSRAPANDELRWSGTTNTSEPAPVNDEEPATLSRSSSQRSQRRSGFHNPSARVSLERPLSRTASLRDPSRRSSLETLHENGRPTSAASSEDSRGPATPPASRKVLDKRASSLRHETRPLSDEDLQAPSFPANAFVQTHSDSGLVPISPSKSRAVSLPPPRRDGQGQTGTETRFVPKRSTWGGPKDPWALPPLPQSLLTPQSLPVRRPTSTFKRYSSLDHLLEYREERQSLKRASYLATSRLPSSAASEADGDGDLPRTSNESIRPTMKLMEKGATGEGAMDREPEQPKSKFRHFIGEIGFCFTIAMTQFLMEYLISGFALVLPGLVSTEAAGSGSTGVFWPAILLSLVLSATLLIFARISDMYGGYYPIMFGLIWLTAWTLVPGFFPSGVMLDVSRAMQGLAIAAFSPSTFALIGELYPENGPRKNLVLGLYGACAPLGFYAGFLAGGALPSADSRWYFFIATALSFITAVTAWLCVPAEKTNRKQFGLKMDWQGAFLITGGLILVAYALAVEPYAHSGTTGSFGSGFASPMVYAPLASGIFCLAVAVWVEGKHSNCPLLPFDFFAPQGMTPFSIACLFFYASFGVWLYTSADYFGSPGVTDDPSGTHGIVQSLWYTPMAIGGIVFCVVGSSLMHIMPVKLLLIISGLAWVGAPLVFAVGPVPLSYWQETMPSMVCATLGIDGTYTIATIFISASQPQKYQGIAGAVSSILVNLAMSFALPISLIVKEAATAAATRNPMDQTPEAIIAGFRAAFLYGTASAAVGLLVAAFFVRIPRSIIHPKSQKEDIEQPRAVCSETSTLVPADE